MMRVSALIASLTTLMIFAIGAQAKPAKPDTVPAKAPSEKAAVVAPEAPPPQLALLIVGPSKDIYTLYGHAAVLVIDDPTAHINKARLFNFGLTSFKRPNYLKDFLTGRVKFWGAATTFKRAFARWKRNDRTVWRYDINLGPGATQRMIKRMEHDTQPDRREYVYDTFRENCATRIRDYLDTYSGGAVYGALGDEPSGRAYRDDVRDTYASQPALLLLTEIFPGPELDRKRSVWEMGYRPESLVAGLETVTLTGEDAVPLLGPAITLHTRKGPNPLGGRRQKGQIFLGFMALLTFAAAALCGLLSPRARGWMMLFWLVPALVVGTILLYITLNTDWPDFQRNALVVGFTPLDLLLLGPAVRLAFFRIEGGWLVRGYLWVRIAAVSVVVVGAPFFDVLDGPYPPRLLALTGLLLCLRCVGWRPGSARA